MPSRPLPAGSRRALLTGRLHPARSPIRPPWARLDRFGELCTRCDACIQACPEEILLAGESGLPEVDFTRGECTFCGTCAEVCPAAVFDRDAATPWAVAAQVGQSCLAAAGVICQACRDCCPVDAVRFRPVRGVVAKPEIDLESCTGCGACVAPCPVAAIRVGEPTVMEAEHAW